MAEVCQWKFAVDNVPNIGAVQSLVASVGLKPMDAVPVVSCNKTQCKNVKLCTFYFQYKVDESVTHLIVGTNRLLQVPSRSLLYLQALAGRSIQVVSHEWVDACIMDIWQLGKAENFFAKDNQFQGSVDLEGGIEGSFSAGMHKGEPPLLHDPSWGMEAPIEVLVSEDEDFEDISR